MICQVVAPMACAASTRPWSTSRSAVSTRRAMNGAEAMVSGTIAAAVPMDVPTKKRVNGITATSKMMNGVERTALTSRPATRLNARLGKMPWRSVRCSAMPSGTPNTAPSKPEMPTIISVSPNELTKRSIISDDMVQFLHHDALRTQVIHCIGNVVRRAVGEDRQRAEGLPLDFIDLAVQDVEVQVVAAHRFRLMRLIHARAGEGKAEQVVGALGRVVLGFGIGQARTQARQHALGQFVRDDVADQGTRDFMLGFAEHVQHFALFDHFAGFHH